MGPHFFKCGKVGIGGRVRLENQALQWGRTFSSAESGLIYEAILPSLMLQWGRTFSSAER